MNIVNALGTGGLTGISFVLWPQINGNSGCKKRIVQGRGAAAAVNGAGKFRSIFEYKCILTTAADQDFKVGQIVQMIGSMGNGNAAVRVNGKFKIGRYIGEIKGVLNTEDFISREVINIKP